MGNCFNPSTAVSPQPRMDPTADHLQSYYNWHRSPNCEREDPVRILPNGVLTSVWKETDRSVSPTEPDVDWRTVVERIRDGDPSGQETLYRNLASGARMFLRRRLGP